MFIGLLMLTAAWATTLNGWVIFYTWSLCKSIARENSTNLTDHKHKFSTALELVVNIL